MHACLKIFDGCLSSLFLRSSHPLSIADDDTYVHMPRLQRTLARLDPTVPMIIGRGIGKLRGFCHGGAGIVVR